jgi:hypothetical protein
MYDLGALFLIVGDAEDFSTSEFLPAEDEW